MTPAELAEIHAACFTVPRPWSAEEFESFLVSDRTVLCTVTDGFALGQSAGPEVELLTIAVRPAAQGQGLGRDLMDQFLDRCRQIGAEDIFLEVDEMNLPAISLYTSCGFGQTGIRKDYYQRPNGPKTACLLMRKSLPLPQD